MSGEDRPLLGATPQAVLGVLVILAGILLTAGNMGWTDARTILAYWPLGLVVLGATMYLRAADPSARLTAVIVVVAGLWLTGGRVFGYRATIGQVWPLLLITVGAALIMRARRREPLVASTGQVISDFAFWSGAERRVTSAAFRKADFTAVMGGLDVDFREAAISGEAVIDVFIIWGGIQIRVPPDWSVSNQVVTIMGGASDKSTGTRESKHRLVIRGFVLMGGIEVKT